MKNLWQRIKSRVAIKTTLFLVLILFVTLFLSNNNFELWEAFLYSFLLLIISGGGQYYNQNQEKKSKNL